VVDINTLLHSYGRIPEAFLRGCGVPESVIQFLPLILNSMEPIQFYSCFISYSSEDQEFAERLYSRMVQGKLCVWYAPDAMQAGKKIHEQTDEAIQDHDKLLMVLSDSSMKSEWVKTEIHKARTAEVGEGKRKLFPIRLVSIDKIKRWQCFDALVGKDSAIEILEYHIPDFSNWKDHDAFEKAFARLLDDLKTNESRR
jgi:hypothetical protein